jgi:hypothetical protein
MRSRTTTVLYSILGSGVALAFLGHGILGAKGSDKFVALVTGSYDKVLGGTISTGTANNIVNVIGGIDIALAVVFAGLVIAAIYRKAIAYSPLALGLFAWAALWGFITALSRFTATLNGHEVWDVVERGPNFMLPAALVYGIYKIRQTKVTDSAPAPVATAENGKSETPPRELAGIIL